MLDSIWVHLVTAQAAQQQEHSLSIFRIISETSGVVFGAICGEVFKAGYIELTKLKDKDDDDAQSMRTRLSGIENVERALRRSMKAEMTHLESLVPYLATVGSTAPFIGLFGTVWGIMVAFVNINAQGAAGLDVVAQPIAEALIVTAIGLFTAIPAVVAYNYFTSRIKILGAEMENFSDDFLNIVKRHFFE